MNEVAFMKLETIMEHESDFGKKMLLQVDKKNNLYVNNKRVAYQEIISLRWYEAILATLTTIAIISEAITSLLVYLK